MDVGPNHLQRQQCQQPPALLPAAFQHPEGGSQGQPRQEVRPDPQMPSGDEQSQR